MKLYSNVTLLTTVIIHLRYFIYIFLISIFFCVISNMIILFWWSVFFRLISAIVLIFFVFLIYYFLFCLWNILFHLRLLSFSYCLLFILLISGFNVCVFSIVLVHLIIFLYHYSTFMSSSVFLFSLYYLIWTYIFYLFYTLPFLSFVLL